MLHKPIDDIDYFIFSVSLSILCWKVAKVYNQALQVDLL